MRILVAVIAVIVWTSAALAERRVALVLAADRYDNLRPLQNAVNDARAVEDALEALGFEVFSERDRNLKRMRRAFEDFEEDAEGADVALVFFAGHGVEISGDNRLLPTDADASSVAALTETSFALNDVQQIVSRVAKTALIIVDACRDDPFGTQSGIAGRGAVSLFETDAVSPGFGRMGSADGTLFAFAAAPGATASDGAGGNSPFTAALTKYLGTEGLEIRSVLTLVQQEVYDRTRGQQLPYVESGLPQLFFASQTSGALPERERLLLAMADIDQAARQDIERVAQDAGVPLAPLYSALIVSDLGSINRQQRRAKLQEAAAAYLKVQDEMTALRSTDPRVTELRQRAQAQLSLGAFDNARALLTEAAETDASSREALEANLAERTLSEAASHYLSGGAALAELNYDLAIADYQRAIGLFEEVENTQYSLAGWEQRISALGTLGHINITIGNLPAAAMAFEQQQVAARDAVAGFPDETGLQLEVAQSRDNLGDVLFEQGKVAEAMAQYRDSHALRALLVEMHPQNDAFVSALSVAHGRLARIHFRQGDIAAAEARYLDKYAWGKRMAARETNGYWWKRDLSVSDEKLGDIQRERGDLEGALARYTASLNRMMPIRDANPDDLELTRFVSIAVERVARTLFEQGDLDAAVTRFEESRDLRRSLVAIDPANTDWQHLLGVSYERIGDVLMRQGDQDAAREAFEAKYQIVTPLSASAPTNVRWLRDLSVADERFGALAHNRGDLDEAAAHFQRSLDRMTPVRDASPTDMELNRFLSYTQSHLANVLMDQGDHAKALDLYWQGLRLRDKLVAHDPQNADWRFLPGVSYELIGNAHMRLDQPTLAVEAYQQALGVMSKLLDLDPSSPRWARAVSLVNEHLGRAQIASGHPEKALNEFRASLTRMAAISQANPTDLFLLRFTGVTLRTLGQTHLDLGHPEDAAAAYVRSLDVAVRLVEANPQNGWWQRDLFVAYNGVLDAGGTPAIDVALASEAATAMQERGTMIPSDVALIEAFEKRVASAD